MAAEKLSKCIERVECVVFLGSLCVCVCSCETPWLTSTHRALRSAAVQSSFRCVWRMEREAGIQRRRKQMSGLLILLFSASVSHFWLKLFMYKNKIVSLWIDCKKLANLNFNPLKHTDWNAHRKNAGLLQGFWTFMT